MRPLSPTLRTPNRISAEDTDDISFDASALDVKISLETLPSVGTVNVTREDMGGDLYAWTVTFTEPATSAHSVTSVLQEDDGTTTTSTILSFPLLYAGGVDSGDGLDLGTLGTGGGVNVTRIHRGTLGPLNGGVSTRRFRLRDVFDRPVAQNSEFRAQEPGRDCGDEWACGERAICFLPELFPRTLYETSLERPSRACPHFERFTGVVQGFWFILNLSRTLIRPLRHLFRSPFHWETAPRFTGQHTWHMTRPGKRCATQLHSSRTHRWTGMSGIWLCPENQMGPKDYRLTGTDCTEGYQQRF